jgi:hypothetical protein
MIERKLSSKAHSGYSIKLKSDVEVFEIKAKKLKQ